jgi:hypothetical protein
METLQIQKPTATQPSHMGGPNSRPVVANLRSSSCKISIDLPAVTDEFEL